MTTQAQLDAILHGAAFAPITDKGFLRITGPDATRWLNGMVTNNIKDLKPGEGNYNFLLNAQGRIQADCTIYREPDITYKEPAKTPAYILETQDSQLETVQQTLDRFIIMDDVELTPTLFADFLNLKESGISLVGAEAPEKLLKLVSGEHEVRLANPPAAGTITRGMVNGTDILILAPVASPGPRYDIWFYEKSEADIELYILRQSKLIEASPETLEAFRIYSGTPKYGIDIRNTETAKDLPQETAQHHALNFNKGCYLGQEIVERIHSRGQVHRTFTRFTLKRNSDSQEIDAAPTELPAPLEANGKPAGEITSVACIHDEKLGDTLYALGYARREALDTHATLTYTGGTAVPLIPNP